ncbi:MAG: glycerol-3-phosphate dehydrogenase C-terminal domain-containing protein, partial [Paenisporosarcina sp.]
WKSTNGLYTIAGGKLTGYRKMAQNVLDKIQSELESINGNIYVACQTKDLRLSGGDFDTITELSERAKTIPIFEKLRIDDRDIDMLVQQYGSNIESLKLVAEEMNSSEGISIPVQLMVDYGIDYEMVIRPTDFFIRRTGSLLFNRDWLEKWKEPVIDYMADKLNWSTLDKVKYKEELESRISEIDVR